MTTIIYRDKKIFLTTQSPIYQYENRVDTLKFLINIDDLKYFKIDSMTCLLCAILPDKQVGKLSFINFEEDLYNDQYLLSEIPITKTITEQNGKLRLFLVFSYEDEDSLFHTLTTNEVILNIIETQATDSFIDPDEETDIFKEMEQKITELENKVDDKVSIIDIVDNTLYVYSDKEKNNLINTIELPAGVVWMDMEAY